MAESGLFGPGVLTNDGVDEKVKGVGPGAYALGRDTPQNFYIEYVGRSDSDLNDRLKKWVGKKYSHFKYAFYPTEKDAFVKECHLFHDFGETNLDNKIDPARPQGTNWTCPRCRALG